MLTLHVCKGWSLRAWILGFGPEARVISPVALARDIFDAVSDTRRRYLRTQSTLEVLSMKAG